MAGDRVTVRHFLGGEAEVKAENTERYAAYGFSVPTPPQPEKKGPESADTEVTVDPESAEPVKVSTRKAPARKG